MIHLAFAFGQAMGAAAEPLVDRQSSGVSAMAAPPTKRQLVGYNNFKRSNPLTDKFKVRTIVLEPELWPV